MTYPPAGYFQGSNSPGDVLMPVNSGEETIPRVLVSTNSAAYINGIMRHTVFQAQKSETVRNVQVPTGNNAQVAATDCWVAVYEIVQTASGPDVWVANLIAQTADDPTLWLAAQTPYQRALVAPFQKVAGHYYSVVPLLQGTTTSPTFPGSAIPAAFGSTGLLATLSPPLHFVQTGVVGGPPAQQAIPGNATTASTFLYGILLP